MNILMISLPFYPSVGGIETMTENLASEFTRKGHKVTVITRTPANRESKKEFSFNVLRNSSIIDIFKEYRQCDIFVHQSISLKYIWPLFLIKKHFFIVYHQIGGKCKGFKNKLKNRI